MDAIDLQQCCNKAKQREYSKDDADDFFRADAAECGARFVVIVERGGGGVHLCLID